MTDALTAFVDDVVSGAKTLNEHESGGAWAALIAALVLTVWVWYIYGPEAGAPLAASFFLGAILLFPNAQAAHA